MVEDEADRILVIQPFLFDDTDLSPAVNRAKQSPVLFAD